MNDGTSIDLFELAGECGCAAKVPAGQLACALADLDLPDDPAVLVGIRTLDDAGIYALDDERCLVQTVDFFPPVARDPYTYGRIAAANALSDVYAMGGRPLTALAIVCFPAKALPLAALGAISRGAADALAEAGCALLGGHSIVDSQPKFGLAVTGVVARGAILDNAHARPGDLLLLTKPLGTGLTIMAIKARLATERQEADVNRSMAALNAEAARLAAAHGVRAATDVTGFGLLGHALQLARASDVTLEFHVDALPRLDGVRDFAALGLLSAAAYGNRAYVGEAVEFAEGIALADQDLCFDPQTSGGLLLACPAERASALVAELGRAAAGSAIVGRVVPAAGATRLRVLTTSPNS
jgi:selenide,water dikinase